MTFLPFVGNKVNLKEKPLILILGESHYGKSMYENLTKEVMQDFVNSKNNIRYYKNLDCKMRME